LHGGTTTFAGVKQARILELTPADSEVILKDASACKSIAQPHLIVNQLSQTRRRIVQAAAARERIMRERKPSAITIFDVAERAGVSYSTVSRVVNDYAHVKPATRAKVQAAMAELGYVANLKARSLAGGRARVVGILIYDLETNYNVEVVRGIDEEVSKRGYDMMLSTTHNRQQKEADYVAKLAQGLVDGLLIVLPSNLDAYYAMLEEQHYPFVLIDHEGVGRQGSGSIQATNFRGSYDATRHLLDLGHRRVATITGPTSSSTAVSSAVDRLAGYKAALRDADVAVDSRLIIEGDFSFAAGYAGAKQLLALAEPPTAIVAASDVTSFGIIERAVASGLTIPADLSVVGFDDIPEAAYRRPALTTIRQPLREMGRLATRMLIAYLEEPETPLTRIDLPTSLQLRGTTAPPR
jgi:LacI family transcriptional regulator